MVLRKVLKYFNIAVAVLLVAALAAAWWFAYRPLPETSGTVRAPLGQKAEIARDSLGVPHIQAASIEDALFLQGFATAQDRLWQMDALRRLAAGQLAEVMGPAALEADRAARRLRLQRIAEAQYAALTPADRAVLAPYVRGVNFFIETHRGRLPVEFALLRYHPRPWSAVDSLAIGMHMCRVLTGAWEQELNKRKLLEAGDRAKVEFLYSVRTGAEPQPGSNAWAISGARTASGQPLLANDPHLDYSFPGIWYAVHLQAPGLNVAGVSLPGVPCVIIGHNDRIAWGMTNLGFDVQDLYAEMLDSQTGRYLNAGRPEQARLEQEVVPVRNARPVELAQWVTRHGPVVVSERNEQFALRWTAADASAAGFPFLELNRARNWEEFRAALARYSSPAQNFVYADRGGNIGYQVAGRLPVRKTYNGDLPADGNSGASEWAGYIPFDELPRSYNPPSGLIVTANQNPFPENYPYRVNGSFAPADRAVQIRALLSARKGWRPEEMIAVQKDVYSALLHLVARQAAAAYDRRGLSNPALAEPVALLKNWNGQMDKDQAAPLLATLIYHQLRRAIVERAAPGRAASYDLEIAPGVVERILREKPRDWFADYDRLLLTALVDAVEEGRPKYGGNVGKWAYGHDHRLTLAHPVLGRLPVIGSYFQIGPLGLSGSSTTVKQTTLRLGPSMRMVVDCADFDKSLLVTLTGQSGQPLSGHFTDQWDAYYYGRGLPMQFREVSAEHVLSLAPE